MNKKVFKLLNEQIIKEFESAYIYLNMSLKFDSLSLTGMKQWMKMQYNEEISHGMKILEFIQLSNFTPILNNINFTSTEIPESPLEIFELAYKHEQSITKSINAIVSIATEENDFSSVNFLQWFVQEQVEEEASALDIVNKLKHYAKDSGGLMFIDSQLSQRKETSSIEENN